MRFGDMLLKFELAGEYLGTYFAAVGKVVGKRATFHVLPGPRFRFTYPSTFITGTSKLK